MGAAHYCVIGSVPQQQLQLAAVRKTRMPVAEATSAPGAAYLGPCCPGTAPCISAASKGSPKADGLSGMPESQAEEGLVLALLLHSALSSPAS